MQRVVRASVTSRATAGDPWIVTGAIESGLCAFVGVTHDDDHHAADRLADRIWGLRVFDDAQGVMNLSLADLVAESGRYGVLVVSQFTLYGDTRKGRRPSWAGAARPEFAEPLVDRVVDHLRALGGAGGLAVATGRFRTEMRVELVNDGPVTLMLES